MNRPFFDTSILLAGLIDFGESSLAPIEILDRVADGRISQASTAWHCCLEFYSVSTRLPEEFRLAMETAQQFVDDEIIGRLGIEVLTKADRKSFFQSAATEGIKGGRIYDFQIGMIARSAGARILVTENKKHFRVFERHGMKILNSEEFLEASHSA